MNNKADSLIRDSCCGDVTQLLLAFATLQVTSWRETFAIVFKTGDIRVEKSGHQFSGQSEESSKSARFVILRSPL